MNPFLGFHFLRFKCPMIQDRWAEGNKCPPRRRSAWAGLGPPSLSGVLLPLRCTQPQDRTAAAPGAPGGSRSGSCGGQLPAEPEPPHPPAARASHARSPPRAQPGQDPKHPSARRLAPETRRSTRSARLRSRRPRRHLTQRDVARASGRSRDLGYRCMLGAVVRQCLFICELRSPLVGFN